MRTISTDQEAVLTGSATARAMHLRVSVKDGGGTFRDLASYAGFNALDSVSMRDDLDSDHASATIVLKRELDDFSVAPDMQSAAVNVGFDPVGAYSALIQLKRAVKIEAAVVPFDTKVENVASGDWFEVFRGQIDQYDAGTSTQLTLTCRDQAGILGDTYIEDDQIYGLGKDGSTHVAAFIWEPSRAYAVGDYVVPTDSKRASAAWLFKCTTAGTSGSSEPAWAGSGTISDGSVVWTYNSALLSSGYPYVEDVIQAVLNKWVSSPPTLYVPSASSIQINPYQLTRQSVLQAVRALAATIGWELRYKWRAASSAFVLTFSVPDRATTTSLRTFDRSQYSVISKWAADAATIRNVVRVYYPDSADLDSQNIPKRKGITVSDSTSITKYGRLFMELGEDWRSTIDTSTEATALANAALSDLKDPLVELGVEFPDGFPFVELNDYYTFSANFRHADTDFKLAVLGFDHRWEKGNLHTELQLRGKPSSGVRRWLNLAVPRDPNTIPSNRLSHLINELRDPAGLTVSAAPIISGGQIAIGTATIARPGAPPAAYEVHVSKSSGFTPSASTLAGVQKGAGTYQINKLTPGTNYYSKVIQRTDNASKPVLGQPTANVSFTAGRASAGHLESGVNWGTVPLNGGFETYIDSTLPPDHWNITQGTIPTDIRVSTAYVYSGQRSVEFRGSGAVASMESDYFQLPLLPPYRLVNLFFTSMERSSGHHTLHWEITEYDTSFGLLATTSGTAHHGSTDVWYNFKEQVVLNEATCFAKVRFYDTTDNQPTYFLDSVYLVAGADELESSGELGLNGATTSSGTYALITDGGSDKAQYLTNVIRVGDQYEVTFQGAVYPGAANQVVGFRLGVEVFDTLASSYSTIYYHTDQPTINLVTNGAVVPFSLKWFVKAPEYGSFSRGQPSPIEALTTAAGVRFSIEWKRVSGASSINIGSNETCYLMVRSCMGGG